MKQCPFLSTGEEKVQCFKECAFFSENNDECPFENLKHDMGNVMELYDNYEKDTEAEDETILYFKRYGKVNFF